MARRHPLLAPRVKSLSAIARRKAVSEWSGKPCGPGVSAERTGCIPADQQAGAPRKKPGLLARLFGRKPQAPQPQLPQTPAKEFPAPSHADSVRGYLDGKEEHRLFSGKLGGYEDTLLTRVLEESGRANLPRVVNAQQMDQLEKEGWNIMYRSVTDNKFLEPFRKGKLYNGSGKFGNGTYAASATSKNAIGGSGNHEAAIHHVKGAYGSRSEPKAMRLALPPHARTISINDARNLRDEQLAKLEKAAADGTIPREEAGRMAEVLTDLGRLAALHNYDAIDVDTGNKGYFVLLNRSILAVQDKDV